MRQETARRGGHTEVLWLNIASSTYVLKDYVNLDSHPFYRLQWAYPVLRLFLRGTRRQAIERFREAASEARVVIHDCRKRLPFEDETVNHILCSHFIEHVYPSEARQILSEFRRVLRPGGTLHLIVPDLRWLAEKYLNSESATAAGEFIGATELTREEPPRLFLRLLTALGYEGLLHRWMYDGPSLTALIQSSQFEIVDRSQVPSAAFGRERESNWIHVAGVKR